MLTYNSDEYFAETLSTILEDSLNIKINKIDTDEYTRRKYICYYNFYKEIVNKMEDIDELCSESNIKKMRDLIIKAVRDSYINDIPRNWVANPVERADKVMEKTGIALAKKFLMDLDFV